MLAVVELDKGTDGMADEAETAGEASVAPEAGDARPSLAMAEDET